MDIQSYFQVGLTYFDCRSVSGLFRYFLHQLIELTLQTLRFELLFFSRMEEQHFLNQKIEETLVMVLILQIRELHFLQIGFDRIFCLLYFLNDSFDLLVSAIAILFNQSLRSFNLNFAHLIH